MVWEGKKSTFNERSDKLTVIIVNIIVAIRFQLNGTIYTSPAFNTNTFVFTILKCTLTMTRASIFASSYWELNNNNNQCLKIGKRQTKLNRVILYCFFFLPKHVWRDYFVDINRKTKKKKKQKE